MLEAELKNTTLAAVIKHKKKRSKKEDQMKSEKKFLVTGPTGAPVVKRLNSFLKRVTPFEH